MNWKNLKIELWKQLNFELNEAKNTDVENIVDTLLYIVQEEVKKNDRYI